MYIAVTRNLVQHPAQLSHCLVYSFWLQKQTLYFPHPCVVPEFVQPITSLNKFKTYIKFAKAASDVLFM